MGFSALLRALQFIKCEDCFFKGYIQGNFFDANGNDALCNFCFENYDLKKEV